MARALKRQAGTVEAGPQVLDQSRFAPANRRRLSAPAFRTFLAIADLWGLGEEERRHQGSCHGEAHHPEVQHHVAKMRMAHDAADALLALHARLGAGQEGALNRWQPAEARIAFNDLVRKMPRSMGLPIVPVRK